MKQNYKLLLIGFFDSVFIVNFVKNLKKYNPEAQIFFWGIKRNSVNQGDKAYLSCYEDYYLFENKHNCRIPILRQIKTVLLWRKNFRKFIRGRSFDVINIHFTRYAYVYILDLIKKSCKSFVVSPWGSDVYKMGPKEKRLVWMLYKAADYCTGPDDRFTNDFRIRFNIPSRKIVELKLGSDAIDYIAKHSKLIDTKHAKSLLGIDDSYAITCGYNASPVQRHHDIINAISQVRGSLPNNLVLIFPFTYGRESSYVESIKNRVRELNIEGVYFEEFLDLHRLFLLRQATDIFIHIQSSDADSASLREYLLCEKKIINGEWLRYKDLEIGGVIPYYTIHNIDELGTAIQSVYHAQAIKTSEKLREVLLNSGWELNIPKWNGFYANISE